MRKLRNAFWIAMLGLLVFGAGAALAAYLIHFNGGGTISTRPGVEVSITQTDLLAHTDANCQMGTLGGNTWYFDMSDAVVGSGSCTFSLQLYNSGPSPAYGDAATFSHPAGAEISDIAAFVIQPADLVTLNYVVTAGTMAEGTSGPMSIELSIDNVP